MILFILLAIVALALAALAFFLTATAAGVVVGIVGAIIQGTRARHQANTEADQIAAELHLSPEETKVVRKDARERAARRQIEAGHAKAAARQARWGSRRPGHWTSVPDQPTHAPQQPEQQA